MVESNIRPVRRGIIVAIAVLTVGISALSSCTSRSPTSPSVLQEKMQVRVQELPASRATAAQGGQLAVAAHQHLGCALALGGLVAEALGHRVLQVEHQPVLAPARQGQHPPQGRGRLLAVRGAGSPVSASLRPYSTAKAGGTTSAPLVLRGEGAYSI